MGSVRVCSFTVLLLLVSAICLCTFPTKANAAMSWKKCGDGEFEIKDATLAPEKITPGTTARFTLDAVGGQEDVADGNIVMLVRLSGLPIYTQQDKLCAKTTCPVKEGAEAKIVYEQDFPEFTPPGSYSLTLSAKSGDGASLFCTEIHFDVVPSSASSQDSVRDALEQS